MRRFFIATSLAMLVHIPAIAHAEEQAKDWRVDLSGGATLVGDVDDQTYGSLAVTREFGEAYVQLSATIVDAGDSQGLIFAVPASSQQLRLSAGTGLGDISVDGYVSIGKREFDEELIANDGNPVLVDSDGDMFGAGASLTYDFLIGDSGFLSPSISVDYSSVDIGRAVNLPNGRVVTAEEEEEGVSATLSLSYMHFIGSEANHAVGPFVSLVASSNSTAFSPGSNAGGSRMAQLVAIRNQPGEGDAWAEFGLSGSFGLTKDLRLNIYATQSVGFIGPEATSLGAGLSLAF